MIRTVHAAVSVVWCFLFLASECLAEKCDGYAAPEAEGPVAWKAWGVVAVCILGLGVSALKDSRRHSMEDV